MKDAVREFGRDPLDEKVWKRLAARMHYVVDRLRADGGEDALVALLAKLDAERGTAGNRVFYLAVPPSAIAALVEQVGSRRGELERLDAPDRREAVRLRPGERATR